MSGHPLRLLRLRLDPFGFEFFPKPLLLVIRREIFERRLTPSQDTRPIGGFGNLIALPLQRRAREQGNSVFVDDTRRPSADQWAFLSTLPRNRANRVASGEAEAEASGRVLRVRMPIDDEFADERWLMQPSRRTARVPITAPLPGH